MTALNREQLREAVQRSQSAQVRIVTSDGVDESEAEPEEAGAPGLPSVTLDAIRQKYEELFKRKPEAHGKLAKTSQFVLIEPDDEVESDVTAPSRRITVVSEEGDIVAEQG